MTPYEMNIGQATQSLGNAIKRAGLVLPYLYHADSKGMPIETRLVHLERAREDLAEMVLKTQAALDAANRATVAGRQEIRESDGA